MEPDARKRILIVDDSPIILERVLDSLKERGSIEKFFTATNYNSALVQIKKNKPGLILLDIKLPGKSGIELLKFITSEYPTIKVIMFSDLLDERYIQLCKKMGACNFIHKSEEFELIPEFLNEY